MSTETATTANGRTIYRINTGALYDHRGNVITVVIDPQKGAYFCDHSRGVDGHLNKAGITLRHIMWAYLHSTYSEGKPAWMSYEERAKVRKDNNLPAENFCDWSIQWTSLFG